MNEKHLLLSNAEIIDYRPELKQYFKSLNYEWLEKYFVVEAHDEEVLSDPDGQIIRQRGYIFFAKCEDKIVGTVAMVCNNNKVYEMAKLAVTDGYKGRHIGKMLVNAVIEKARLLGAKKVFLVSNRKLAPALNLYLKTGFVEVSLTSTDYIRGDIQMELELTYP